MCSCVTVLFATHEAYLEHLTGPGHPERPSRLQAVVAGARAAASSTPWSRWSRVAAARRPRAGPPGVVPRPPRRAGRRRWRLDRRRHPPERRLGRRRPPGRRRRPDRRRRARARAGATPRSAPCARRATTPRRRDVDGLLPRLQHRRRRRRAGRRGGAGVDRRLRRPPRQRHPGRVLSTTRACCSSACTSGRCTRAPGGVDEHGSRGRVRHDDEHPAAAGTTGDVYLRAFDEVIAPAVERFAPTWLLISAGFDAHRADPLTELGADGGRLRAAHGTGAGRSCRPGRLRRDARGRLRPRRPVVVRHRRARRRWPARRREPERPSNGGPGAAVVAEARRLAAPRRMNSRVVASAAPRVCRDRASSTRSAMIPTASPRCSHELAPLAERFAAAGHRLYLVGGAVRDLLVGGATRRSSTSTSRPTPGRPRSSACSAAGPTPCGRRASGSARSAPAATGPTGRTAPSRSRRSAPRPTSTTRASRTSRSPTTSRPTSAAATSPSTRWRSSSCRATSGATLVDPFGGAADLATGTLRTPLAPEISFDDDPLRMLRAARFIARYGLRPVPELTAAVVERGGPAGDRVAGADPRRAGQADRRRSAVGGAVVPRRHRPGRALPARAAGAAPRARPDPPPQGRAEPHDRRGRERAPARRRRRLRLPRSPAWRRCSTTSASRAPAGTSRARATTFHHHDVVGARMTRRAHGGAALPVGRHRRRRRARLPAPALPHLQDGVERLGRAALRARRRRPARRAQRADPLRLHDARRAQGGPAGHADGRAGGPHRRAGGSARSWPRSGPSSTARR